MWLTNSRENHSLSRITIKGTMKYPIGVRNFEKVIKEDYLYIDKTALLYKMVTDSGYYFLSRPRRFGKYVVFKLLGFYVDVERTTSRGRIDMTVKTHDYIYVIEIKLDGTAEEALQQIEDKGYAKPYAKDQRQLYKIGINFSSEKHGIGDWKMCK